MELMRQCLNKIKVPDYGFLRGRKEAKDKENGTYF
jgi:hypothetical protein